MSHERKQGTKLAQSRRRNALEDDDVENETGPAIIDDSASEASDDDLQLSASDEEEEDETDKTIDVKHTAPANVSSRTSESYDRLEDDTLQGRDFVDLAASNQSVGVTNVTETAIIMNGFKDIPTEEGDTPSDTPLQFDELDDTISFEPRVSETKSSTRGSARGVPFRGGAPDRSDREPYWQRRNREKEEYKKKLEDPTFTPYVGDFFMHDSRKRRPFDSLNQFDRGGRGRGRGRGLRGGHQRETAGRNVRQEEPSWGHDGFEELEPRSPQGKQFKGNTRSQTSSVGRQTPQPQQKSHSHNVSESQPTPAALQSIHAPQTSKSPAQKEPAKTEEPTQNARPNKALRANIISLNTKTVTMRIFLPNSKETMKEVALNSYVGRVPYRPSLRGDRPVKISLVEGAETREAYPSKERSWLPYFLKNAVNVEAFNHARGRSVASAGTPNSTRAERNTPNRVPSTAVHAPSFNPQSPSAALPDDDDKPTKIKVNLPPATTTSASPAVSDTSSLHVHHPRPTKHINIADIQLDDTSARLKAFLNPQTSASPAHSHERTPSTAIPETAVHAAPFQPGTFLPQQPQQVASPFPAVPYYYPPFTTVQTDYPVPSTQANPYLQQQPRFESNGMVYYYDPASYYYFQNPGTPQPNQQPPSEQTTDPVASQMYYYPPPPLGSQVPVPDPQRAGMGMYFPYQQGT